jgi:hypothetical protein
VDYVTGLACAPRSRFCVAAFSEGQMFTYNGTRWLRSTATGGAFPSVTFLHGGLRPRRLHRDLTALPAQRRPARADDRDTGMRNEG